MTLTTREKAIEWWKERTLRDKEILFDYHNNLGTIEVTSYQTYTTLNNEQKEKIYLSEHPESKEPEAKKEVVNTQGDLLENKLYKWHEAHFPPIDLNANVSEVVRMISENKRLSKDNTLLKECVKAMRAENDKLRDLESSFYMAICRAYNAGKQNQINIVLTKESTDEDKMFLSSHNYFITEFPEFKTNIP